MIKGCVLLTREGLGDCPHTRGLGSPHGDFVFPHRDLGGLKGAGRSRHRKMRRRRRGKYAIMWHGEHEWQLKN